MNPPDLPVAWRDIAPGGPGLFVPVDPDALLDALDDETFRATDERMPYFAALWPAGEVLAASIVAGPRLDGLRVLDLGCGTGIVGVAAAWRGARVTFLDWEPRAFDLVRRSLEKQGLQAEGFVVADWRTPPPMEPFERILAADVLYEERNMPGVLRFASAHVAPGGEVWIADPGRRHAAGLEEKAAEAGLVVASAETLPGSARGAEVRLTRLCR